MIHADQIEATDPVRYDPLAQAVLLASSDPLAEQTKGPPGWQKTLPFVRGMRLRLYTGAEGPLRDVPDLTQICQLR
jgi:hypothetical protein